MVNVLYISVAVVAIAFFILVIYLIGVLKSLRKTLESVNETLIGFEKQMQGISSETEALLQKTNLLAADIQSKSDSINGIFLAARDLGNSISKISYSLGLTSNKIQSKAGNKDGKLAKAMQVSSVAVEIGNNLIQNKKNKNE